MTWCLESEPLGGLWLWLEVGILGGRKGVVRGSPGEKVGTADDALGGIPGRTK